MNFQRVAAVARQVLAVASIVMGALTQAVSAIHLSPAVSSVLVAIGGAILGIEHYVGDPSTGSPSVTLPPMQTVSRQAVVEAHQIPPPPPPPPPAAPQPAPIYDPPVPQGPPVANLPPPEPSNG